ncbi:MAG: hypothetical protein WKF57_06550 [Nakamurella sp.]
MKSAERPDPSPTSIYHLSDLYDADRAAMDPAVAEIRRTQRVPHPLREVQYADGVWRDSTAGRIHAQGRRVERPFGATVYGLPDDLREEQRTI